MHPHRPRHIHARHREPTTARPINLRLLRRTSHHIHNRRRVLRLGGRGAGWARELSAEARGSGYEVRGGVDGWDTGGECVCEAGVKVDWLIGRVVGCFVANGLTDWSDFILGKIWYRYRSDGGERRGCLACVCEFATSGPGSVVILGEYVKKIKEAQG